MKHSEMLHNTAEIASPRPKPRKAKHSFAVSLARAMTARLRVLPNFIIAGAQRCGTTSLYNNLVQHPDVVTALVKEIHFFDVHFRRGPHWYRSHFPSYLGVYLRRLRGRATVTGEASPYYLFHPHAARRVAATVPNARIIVMLRNPIDRAYSHYQHERRRGFEPLDFGAAIEQEQARMDGELRHMLDDEEYDSFAYRHHSYLARGMYAGQLRAWRELVPAERMLVLRSEDFYRDSRLMMREVATFLGLSAWEPAEYRRFNSFNYEQMDAATRARLAELFRPHNRELYELIGVDFGWDA
jgi:hypothetical protein